MLSAICCTIGPLLVQTVDTNRIMMLEMSMSSVRMWGGIVMSRSSRQILAANAGPSKAREYKVGVLHRDAMWFSLPYDQK